MLTSDAGPTRKLASFAAGLNFDTLPEEVIEGAKELILNQLGAELAASNLPWCKSAYDYSRRMGSVGKSTVLNYGLKTNAENAAFVNGTFGHGYEIDDYHLASLSHPGCVIIPAALAVAEQEHKSGKDFLLAVVVGYEVMLRIGSATLSSALERGFHPTATVGPFGAAAAVAKLRGFSAEELTSAFGLAGSMASGLTEYQISGGQVKKLHGGIAAANGIKAAFLVAEGFTGPTTILEGKRGFCQAFANEYQLDALVEGLARKWLISSVSIKPWSSCGSIHPSLTIVEELKKRHSIHPSNVKAISVGVDRPALLDCAQHGPEPKDLMEAQFSIGHSLALNLSVGSNDANAYTVERLKDIGIVELARKVSVALDKECESESQQGRALGKVTVDTLDGRSFSGRAYAKGTAENPLSREEVTQKFIAHASTVLPMEKTQKLIDIVANLERNDDMTTITSLLVA